MALRLDCYRFTGSDCEILKDRHIAYADRCRSRGEVTELLAGGVPHPPATV